jgi:MFS family permease
MTTDSRTHRRAPFVFSGLALFALIIGTNLPSPFYAVYAERFGFSPFVLTLIFAAYAATLIPTLLIAGSLAEAVGFRRVILLGLVSAAISSVVFACASSVGFLFLARALQGLSVGVCSGALTAALSRTAPPERLRTASLIASLVTTAGGGLGPIVAGIGAEVLPAPAVSVYLIESAVLMAAAAGILTVPAALGRGDEQVGPKRPLGRGERRQADRPARGRAAIRLSLPTLPPRASTDPEARSPLRVFLTACAVTFTGWAVTAVFLSIIPSCVTMLTGSRSMFIAGLAAGIVLVTAAAVQPAVQGLGGRMLECLGLTCLAVALIVLLFAGDAASLPLILISAVIAGVGQGMGFMGAMRESAGTALPGAEAATASAFYIATYLGVGLPTIGVGLLATSLATTKAVEVFAIIALIASAGLAFAVRPRRRVHSSRLRESRCSPR